MINRKKWIYVSVGCFVAFGHFCEGGIADASEVQYQAVALAKTHGLILPVDLAYSQSETLNSKFRQQFRIVKDLTSSALKRYVADSPTEFWAVNQYIGYLYRSSYIAPETYDQLRQASILGMEMAIANRRLPAPLEIPQQKGAPTDTLELQKEQNQTPELDRAVELFQAALRGENLERKLLTDAASKVESTIEESGHKRLLDVFDNAKLAVTGIIDGKPWYEVGALVALSETDQTLQFQETTVSSHDGKTTVNLGIGTRTLSSDDRWLFGANTFYDYELETGHQRASIGAEVKSTPFELAANRYFGLTGYKLDSDGNSEKPVDGYDLRSSVALPYMPGLHATYNLSNWKGDDATPDLERQSLGLKGQLSKNLSIAYDNSEFSDGRNDSESIRLEYSWIPSSDQVPTVFEFSRDPWEFKPLGEKRYDFVERETEIVKQNQFEVRIVVE